MTPRPVACFQRKFPIGSRLEVTLYRIPAMKARNFDSGEKHSSYSFRIYIYIKEFFITIFNEYHKPHDFHKVIILIRDWLD